MSVTREVVSVLAASALALCSNTLLAQEGEKSTRFLGIGAGMGVVTHSAPSLVDYINAASMPMAGQQLDEFSSAVELFIAPEFQISDDWILTLEYAALLKTYSITGRGGFQSEFSYVVHMPTFLLQRLIRGEGYRLKFGGGLGYHVAELEQRFPDFGSEDEFTARGMGIMLDATGHTQFDEHFFGLIGFNIRWDFPGTLKREDGSPAIDRTDQSSPTMNFFAIGFRLGVMFRLN